AGAENAGERGEQNEEWKHRHQRGERDVACDRPAVVGEETPIGIEGDIESSSHRSVQPLAVCDDSQVSAGYPKRSMSFQVVNNAATAVQVAASDPDMSRRRCFCALHA